MPIPNSSTKCRYKRADLRRSFYRPIAIRKYKNCKRLGSYYIIISEYYRYTECDKLNRKYDLAPPEKKIK